MWGKPQKSKRPCPACNGTKVNPKSILGIGIICDTCQGTGVVLIYPSKINE